jgi:integrase
MVAAASARAEIGLKVQAYTFADAAASFAREKLPGMEPEKKQGEYRRIIDNNLVPYFGQMELARMQAEDIEDYYEWRQAGRAALIAEREQAHARRSDAMRGSRSSRRREAAEAEFSPGIVGKRLSPSTINTENSVLRAVLAHAVRRRMIGRDHVPAIVNRSVKNQESREAFTDKEIDKLLEFARREFGRELMLAAGREAKREGREPPKVRTALGREVAADSLFVPSDPWALPKSDPLRIAYEAMDRHRDLSSKYRLWHAVIILAATGLRPDSLLRMRRRHVRRLDDAEDGSPRATLLASTRKGGRTIAVEVVPEAWAMPAILRLAEGDQDAPLLDYATSHALNKRFVGLLDRAGLLVGAEDRERSLYSLRHYYITRKLRDGVSVAAVATNTLTSVAMIEKHYNHLKSVENYDQLANTKKRLRRRT